MTTSSTIVPAIADSHARQGDDGLARWPTSWLVVFRSRRRCRGWRILLRQALGQYRRAAGARSRRRTAELALINRNVCSIRKRLAGSRPTDWEPGAIEECEIQATALALTARVASILPTSPAGLGRLKK